MKLIFIIKYLKNIKMGIECSTGKRNNYLQSLIERKLEHKDTPLDMKIHNEYLNIFGFNDDNSINTLKEQVFLYLNFQKIPKLLHNHVSKRKKVSRFKKWYKMAFIDLKSNYTLTQEQNDYFKNNESLVKTPSSKSSTKSMANQNNRYNVLTSLNRNGSEKSLSFRERLRLIDISPVNRNRKYNIPPIKAQYYNEKVCNYAVNQAEIGLRKFVEKNKEKFKERLCKGPPESFRWISWMISSNIDEDRSEDFYKHLLSQEIDLSVESQIKKDINRTIREECLYCSEELKITLFNVLKAYSILDKEVSYCQGMNFVIAFMLIVSDFNEVDTMYMMINLFMSNNSFKKKLGVRGFYLNDFPLLHYYMFIFNSIFHKYLPNLKHHFEKLDVPNELWISKWFQTLFTICLPLDVLTRLWDCIFVKGLDFIFNFTISLLKYIERDLLKLNDISEASDFFKHLNMYFNSEKRMKIDIEELIQEALNFKIPKDFIISLTCEYELTNNFKISSIEYKLDFHQLYTDFQLKNIDKLSEDLVVNISDNFKIVKLNEEVKSKFFKRKQSRNNGSEHVNVSSYQERISQICDIDEANIIENYLVESDNMLNNKLKDHTLKINTNPSRIRENNENNNLGIKIMKYTMNNDYEDINNISEFRGSSEKLYKKMRNLVINKSAKDVNKELNFESR
jgi:hypothetical protein